MPNEQFAALFTKEKFIEWIARQIQDDEIVVMTNIHNNISVGGKKNDRTKKITFEYAANDFKRNDSIGDILNQKNIALMISDRQIFTDETLNLITE